MKYVKTIIKIMLVIFALLMIFVVGFYKIDGRSMMPNFRDENIIVYNKLSNEYKRFDIVIVQVEGVTYIKRIIGLPHENLKYENNKLYINNVEVNEPFKKTKTDDFMLNNSIPVNKYLVLGDNRSESYDGRNFGFVDISNINGKVLFKVF